jgi:hypothetical protein
LDFGGLQFIKVTNKSSNQWTIEEIEDDHHFEGMRVQQVLEIKPDIFIVGIVTKPILIYSRATKEVIVGIAVDQSIP